MKVSELNALIEGIVSDEVKKTITEAVETDFTVYHVMCDGEPVDTFRSEDEAKEHVDKLTQDHPGKQFIIEKKKYESHGHMIDKLDDMGQQLEEKEQTMKKQPNEGNAFSGALAKAKANHEDEFEVDGHEYEVEENWDNPTGAVGHAPMEEDDCNECGGGYMEEEHDHNMCECGAPMDEESGMCSECGKVWEERADEGVCSKCGKEICECGSIGMEEEGYMGTPYASSEDMAVDMLKKGIHESKKKSIRLTESELVKMISGMVNEAMKGEPGAPGVPGVVFTQKAQKGSKKENEDALKDIDKKLRDYLNFDGNDHSEFPHQNGVATKKMARTNSKEEDDEVAKNFAGLENLDYDVEPSDQFKDRMKKAIEGHSTMGNAPTTEKASIKPSNGGDKGKESEHKEGNAMKTPETAKKIEKQVKARQEDKDNRVLYPKEKVPVKKLNESKVDFKSIINDEINKMKRLSSYNKKTQ